ncbi:MAG: DUF4079 domain-containing protein [Cyanobacteria bacterium J083]|nr:MAG: DUF4079 domain-containing protein [Cyanobacteria bacterium J083]
MELAIPESVKVWSQFAHPLLMWVLLALTIYALYLGIQAKKTRTADKETRKELIKQKFGLRHHQIGSIVLALMVLGCIGGMAVTYINNGKLFVGPHLLVGLGMTGLIAVSAALVPLMQNGKIWARKVHAGLNMSLVTLFVWQAYTGLEILQRIISKM